MTLRATPRFRTPFTSPAERDLDLQRRRQGPRALGGPTLQRVVPEPRAKEAQAARDAAQRRTVRDEFLAPPSPTAQAPVSSAPPGAAPIVAQPSAPPPAIPSEEEREAIVANAKANTSEEQQRAFLTGLGIPDKHLNDTYGDKLSHAFGESLDALLQPGEHKRSLKIDNQYDLHVKVGDNLELLSASAAHDRDSSFLGKVLDTVAPYASTVGALLGPVTGGISTAVGAAISAVQAVRNKDWLGLASSVASGVGGFIGNATKLAGGVGTLAASKGAQALATGANFLSNGIKVVQGGLQAYQTGNLGGIVSAAAQGVGLVADGLGSAGEQFSGLADTLGRASRVTLHGTKAVQSLTAGDYLGAAESILGAGAVVTAPSRPTPGALPAGTAPTLSDRLAQASAIAGTAGKAKAAYETGNYANLLAEGLRLAHQVSGSERLDRAADVAKPTAELLTAIQAGDLKEIGQSAKKLYDVAAEFEQLNLPKNPLDLAKGVWRRVAA